MRRHLVEFLFGPDATSRDLEDPGLGDRIVRMFEEADAAEREFAAINKKPLETVLRTLGVSEKVQPFHQWAEIHFDCPEAYREACTLLFEPEALSALADAGWIPTRCGDAAMANEVADLKIGFFEISTTDTPPSMERVAKDSAEDGTTAMERGGSNPDKVSGEPRAGVGRPTAGKAPEGSIKGASRYEAQSAQELAHQLLEMTSAGSVPPVTEPPLALMRPPQRRLKAKRVIKQRHD